MLITVAQTALYSLARHSHLCRFECDRPASIVLSLHAVSRSARSVCPIPARWHLVVRADAALAKAVCKLSCELCIANVRIGRSPYGQAVKKTSGEDTQRDRIDHRLLIYRPAKPFLAVLASAAGLTNNPFEHIPNGMTKKKQTNKGENQCQESKREELFSFCSW
jgi:hypothetical protein